MRHFVHLYECLHGFVVYMLNLFLFLMGECVL